MGKKAINIIFDGPPGSKAGRFVEVETEDGKGLDVGEGIQWIEKADGYWALRIVLGNAELQSFLTAAKAENERLRDLLEECEIRLRRSLQDPECQECEQRGLVYIIRSTLASLPAPKDAPKEGGEE